MQILCKQIGPRPATSDKEREAAGYVKRVLDELGVDDVSEQTFKSQNSLGWIVLPAVLASALAVVIAGVGGVWGKIVGSVLASITAYTLWSFSLCRPPIFQRLIACGTSQNVIARIPSLAPPQQTLYLVGHLDTQKQNFTAPPVNPRLMKFQVTMLIGAPIAIALSLLWGALTGQPGITWWQWVYGGVFLVTALLLFLVERQPQIEGANDNATAVSVLLAIAEALQAHHLKETEVVLLFTGCEEVVCVGIENHLVEFAPPQASTYWLDLEMVGTGNLCYVTQHGVSYLTPYTPAEEMIDLAEKVAQTHPELSVCGKEMLMTDEIANLRRRGYKAICLAGYGEDGYLPNWHRLSDTLENIEPDTLSRAACFTWAMVRAVDALSDGG